MSELLSASQLKVHFNHSKVNLFSRRPPPTRAVDGIDVVVSAGETLGIVGESGCGKSTLARALIGLTQLSAGQVMFREISLTTLNKRKLRLMRKKIQMIFQDPLASLNPRLTIAQAIAEPLHNFESKLSRNAVQQKVVAALEQVGLSLDQFNRYPHELSGGQCQRVGIARALIINPDLIICDEPVSALDVSIQAQIINLLIQVQQQHNIALIFIAHDLSVVRHISHRVMVMYRGKVVEQGPCDELFTNPRHPYTQLLLRSVPIPEPKLGREKLLKLTRDSTAVSDAGTGSGCGFYDRCPHALLKCLAQVPELIDVENKAKVACHLESAQK